MQRQLWVLYGAVAAAAAAAAATTAAAAAAAAAESAPAAVGRPPVVDVDWAGFLSRADLLYEWNTTGPGAKHMPTGWWNSAFLGNGNLGVQVVAGLHNVPQPSGLPPKPSLLVYTTRT